MSAGLDQAAAAWGQSSDGASATWAGGGGRGYSLRAGPRPWRLGGLVRLLQAGPGPGGGSRSGARGPLRVGGAGRRPGPRGWGSWSQSGAGPAGRDQGPSRARAPAGTGARRGPRPGSGLSQSRSEAGPGSRRRHAPQLAAGWRRGGPIEGRQGRDPGVRESRAASRCPVGPPCLLCPSKAHNIATKAD